MKIRDPLGGSKKPSPAFPCVQCIPWLNKAEHCHPKKPLCSLCSLWLNKPEPCPPKNFVPFVSSCEKQEEPPLRIAFLDSGIGGLTVLRQALTVLPTDQFVYYADTLNAPYGVKPKTEVFAHVLAAADFLASLQIDALVLACNTATAVAVQTLRERYPFPVIGMEPAVKPALMQGMGKVMVFATSLTLRESRLEALISNLGQSHRVECRALDRLVRFAEAFDFTSRAVSDYLADRLADIRWSEYESAVLGCTHFLFYRDLIQECTGPDIRLIDGNQGTVSQLARVLEPLRAQATAPVHDAAPRVTFYASGHKETPARVERMLALLSAP